MKRTSGLDVYVRQIGENDWQACADKCDGRGHWHTERTAYGRTPDEALDRLEKELAP